MQVLSSAASKIVKESRFSEPDAPEITYDGCHRAPFCLRVNIVLVTIVTFSHSAS